MDRWKTYTKSNSDAKHTLTSASGCDSLIQLNLTVKTTSNYTDSQIACNSYTWINGITYTSSNNTAKDTLINALGCDSVVTLNLTIGSITSSVDTQTACNSYTWINGVTYTYSNNTAKDTLINALGCDSIITLNLTIGSPTSSTDVQTVCGSYTWINGITYTSSNNTAKDTLINALGCDSIVTLDLTILNSTSSIDVQTACDSFTWINGITYTSDNNTATDTLTNSIGCDSIITLDLTILNSTSSIDTQTACSSYTWINGITYTANNNTATDTLTNAVGCDSIITLDLTILNTTSSIDTQTACGSYTWINGVTYTANNTTATDTLVNALGCDSIITLHLTIASTTSSTDVQTTCNSYTWINGITYTTNNTTATDTLTNAEGCDSIITLDLTINSIDKTVRNDAGILTAVESDATYQWIDCNTSTPITGATAQTFTPSANGEYAVEIDKNGCSERSDCVSFVINGLHNNQKVDISFFPNPTNGIININSLTQINHVEVMDIRGSTLLMKNKNTLDISMFEKGIYFLKVSTNKGTVIKKIVKKYSNLQKLQMNILKVHLNKKYLKYPISFLVFFLSFAKNE